MQRRIVIALIGALLMACSGSREGVHEARFQKRRHLSGWQLDLRARHNEAPPRVRLREVAPRTVPMAELAPIEAREPIASLELDPARIDAPQRRAIGQDSQTSSAAPELPALQQEEDENLMPRKKWNAVAVPAFVSALGAVALGFGTDLWLLVGAIALTFILCAWSIARIRRKDQAGKGFTMAALIIGVLAALITVMSIGRYGTEL